MKYFFSTYNDMIKQDSIISYKILQDFQKLEVLALSKNRQKFYEPIHEISGLCMEYSGLAMFESEFYSLVKHEFLKLPKNLFS